MQVTIIMGVYNPPIKEELDMAIQSILNQTLEEFEFLIVDDGSHKTVKEWLLEYAQLDQRIRIITKPCNTGLASALNTCIQEAKGTYIARMDADDKSCFDRLQVQYDFLEQHKEYAFVGSNARLMDEQGVWGMRAMPEQPEDADFLPYSPFIHPSVMVRKSVYESCGGYREGKETWRSEDYEIFMRMYAMGYKGYNLQTALFDYRENRNSYEKRKYKYRYDEMKIRARHFKGLKVNPVKKVVYIMKPLVVGLLPVQVIQYIKQMRGRKELYVRQERIFQSQYLSEYTTEQFSHGEYSESVSKAM